jgi:phosphoribosylformimino-5-aminoimidazole carboxamide ribotide isomerase
MRIIPVIDLKGGVAVHGIAGQRARYQPIRSVLASDSGPGTVARAFAETGAFREVYVADLDAIAGSRPDWDALHQIADSGLKIWLDAGVDGTDRLRELISFSQQSYGLEAVIIGLESLCEPDTLQLALAELGGTRCIFSLDLRDGRTIARHGPWQNRTSIEIAGEAFGLGVRRMILLDIATVGTGRGPQSLALAARLRAEYPTMELIGGGGVRNLDDLAALAAAGFSAVLVATALHRGAIRPSDLGFSAGPDYPRAWEMHDTPA